MTPSDENYPLDEIDMSDASSFLSAAFKGEIQKIRYFMALEKNPKMNVVDSLGNTALHLSAFSGHENVVKLLLRTRSVLNSPKVLHALHHVPQHPA
jgi:ankyrin repeat protein